MIHYFLNIGSNLGNVKLNISRALRALESRFGYFETSKMVESAPWGFVSPNRFANIAVMVISEKTPAEVLADIKEIEVELNVKKGESGPNGEAEGLNGEAEAMVPTPHRDAVGGYADRVLDIDIMAADELVVDTDELKIPHPHLAERRFYLEPFEQLAPGWRHPVTGKTPGEMLAEL